MAELEQPIEETSKDEVCNGKIYCANCIHCKLIPVKHEGEELRIRCTAEKWKKKLGEEKMYKYSTIMRRYLDSCDRYEEMGESGEFIRELRKIQDTIQEVEGANNVSLHSS
jgi:hypothetical protein